MQVDVPEDAVRAALGQVEELEELGEGGQGRVWRVRQSGQDDVIKVIPDVDTARVEREVAALKAVDSPNVMKFKATLTIKHNSDEWPAIRGEFIPGGTVAKKLEAGKWPSELEALQCARGVLEGLAALHDQDLVHRDIKHLNIALRDGDWDQAVVLDLGLVRDLASTSITQYPNRLGTLPFMAPEQLRLERAVKRTDIFAVGALLFYLLTQDLPYVSHTDDQGLDAEGLRKRMLERAEKEDWPRWSRVQSKLSPDVAVALSRLLAREAYERPKLADAMKMLDELIAARV